MVSGLCSLTLLLILTLFFYMSSSPCPTCGQNTSTLNELGLKNWVGASFIPGKHANKPALKTLLKSECQKDLFFFSKKQLITGRIAQLISWFMSSWIIIFSITGFPANYFHIENLFLSFMLHNMNIYTHLPNGFNLEPKYYFKSVQFAREHHPF